MFVAIFPHFVKRSLTHSFARTLSMWIFFFSSNPANAWIPSRSLIQRNAHLAYVCAGACEQEVHGIVKVDLRYFKRTKQNKEEKNVRIKNKTSERTEELI